MRQARNIASGVVGLMVLAALTVGVGTLLRSTRPPSEAAGPPPPTALPIPTVALATMAPQRDQPTAVPSAAPEVTGEAPADAPWFLVYGGEAPPELAQIPYQWVPHILPLDEKGNPLAEPRPVIPKLPEGTPADVVCDGVIIPSPNGQYAASVGIWGYPVCVIDLQTGQAWPMLRDEAARWAIDRPLGWYPDSRGFMFAAGGTWLVDVETGQLTSLLSVENAGLGASEADTAAVLADGRILLAVRTPAPPFYEFDTIWIVDVESGKAEKLKGDVYFESLSSDRQTIYYRDAEDSLKAMDGQGRDVRPDERFIDAQDSAKGLPIWSPDGTRFVFSARERPLEKGEDYDGITGVNIYLQDLSTGQLQVLSRDSVYPAWSPDGSMIAFGRRGQRSLEIWIANADGSGLRQVTDDSQNKGGLWWLGGQER